MAVLPSHITKAVIKEMVEENKDATYAKNKMIDLWQDAFPILAYLDDVEAIKKKKSAAKKAAPPKKTATDSLKADIGFAELWGDDINDATAYAGLAMSSAKEAAEELEVTPVELHGHLAEGLTRAQLARTGFKEHGGMVLTLLNPMLESLKTNVRVGSHLYFRANRYVIAEKTEILMWDAIKKNLYTVINVIQD